MASAEATVGNAQSPAPEVPNKPELQSPPPERESDRERERERETVGSAHSPEIEYLLNHVRRGTLDTKGGISPCKVEPPEGDGAAQIFRGLANLCESVQHGFNQPEKGCVFLRRCATRFSKARKKKGTCCHASCVSVQTPMNSTIPH